MIIVFDLNDLKKCNDKNGHMVGDEYIVASSKIIKKTFMEYGRVYRIGGDEFCVLMPNIELENGKELLKKNVVRYCGI